MCLFWFLGFKLYMRNVFDDIGFHSWLLTLLHRCNDLVIHSKVQRSIAQLFNKMWFQGTIREVLYSPTALDDHDMQYLQMLYSTKPSSPQPGVDVFGFHNPTLCPIWNNSLNHHLLTFLLLYSDEEQSYLKVCRVSIHYLLFPNPEGKPHAADISVLKLHKI